MKGLAGSHIWREGALDSTAWEAYGERVGGVKRPEGIWCYRGSSAEDGVQAQL